MNVDPKLVLAAIELILNAPIKFDLKKQFGIIHKRELAEIAGQRGFLIWDYILWNEISFQYEKDDKVISFYQSISDKKTQAEWDRLVEKFGI